MHAHGESTLAPRLTPRGIERAKCVVQGGNVDEAMSFVMAGHMEEVNHPSHVGQDLP
jgi:hypothetical protein